MIEQQTRVAEELVTAVAQCQHRITQVLQPAGRLGADRLPEQQCVVGELAVAECRHHRYEMRCGLQVREINLVELDRLGFDSGGLFQGLGERHRSVLGIAHIGAIADDQRKIRLGGHSTPSLARAGLLPALGEGDLTLTRNAVGISPLSFPGITRLTG